MFGQTQRFPFRCSPNAHRCPPPLSHLSSLSYAPHHPLPPPVPDQAPRVCSPPAWTADAWAPACGQAPHAPLAAAGQATGPGWKYQASSDTDCSKETVLNGEKVKELSCLVMVKMHLLKKVYFLACSLLHKNFLACFIYRSIISLFYYY